MKNDNAYPLPNPDLLEAPQFQGLTKREYFAGIAWTELEIKAMARKITDKTNKHSNFADYVSPQDRNILTKARIRLADELLKQLEEK